MTKAKKLLFIEDNDVVRTYYVDHLKTAFGDYEIVEAVTGKTGLDLYRSLPFDCVILDLSLPDGSGFDVLAKLVPVRSQPGVPVVILTSIGSQSILDIAKDKGAFAALQKDLTPGQQLATVVSDAIERHRAVRPWGGGPDLIERSLPESDS